MNSLSRLMYSKPTQILAGLLMAFLLGWFSYRHMIAFQMSGELTYLLLCTSEILAAAFFILRSSPKTISTDPLDYLFAVGGTFAPLFFSPAAWGLFPVAKNLVILGAALQILGLISLNRSFAIVAANRQIKTEGMYRFVRHPLYASYLIIYTGYVLANTTLLNFAIYFITVSFLLVRIAREEKHLIQDVTYAEYMQRVRYRVIPFVV